MQEDKIKTKCPWRFELGEEVQFDSYYALRDFPRKGSCQRDFYVKHPTGSPLKGIITGYRLVYGTLVAWQEGDFPEVDWLNGEHTFWEVKLNLISEVFLVLSTDLWRI